MPDSFLMTVHRPGNTPLTARSTASNSHPHSNRSQPLRMAPHAVWAAATALPQPPPPIVECAIANLAYFIRIIKTAVTHFFPVHLSWHHPLAYLRQSLDVSLYNDDGKEKVKNSMAIVREFPSPRPDVPHTNCTTIFP